MNGMFVRKHFMEIKKKGMKKTKSVESVLLIEIIAENMNK
jgi:hypothetical protein